MNSLILASGSIWRKRLLKKHGFVVKVIVSDFDEIKKASEPAFIPFYNAFGKAATVREKILQVAKASNSKKEKSFQISNTWIVGVDTIGAHGKKILLKPKDKDDARKMLLSLSGTTHYVITGLVLMNAQSGACYSTVVKTAVTFKEVQKDELERYLDSNQWVGKAGSYAIQGRAKGFVKKIDGDTSNVVGLPIPEFIQLCAQAGLTNLQKLQKRGSKK